MKISIFHKFAILGMLFAVFSVNAMAEPVPGYNPSEARDGITGRIIALGLEFEVNAGTNIGGAAPLPLPGEIREINSYSPNLNLQIGGTATKWFDVEKRWGAAVGIRFETKGMETKATVKNYGMEILENGKILKGNWTGKVQTKYHTQQLVVPITAVYRVNRRLKVNFGPYLSYALTMILTVMCPTVIFVRVIQPVTNMCSKVMRWHRTTSAMTSENFNGVCRAESPGRLTSICL